MLECRDGKRNERDQGFVGVGDGYGDSLLKAMLNKNIKLLLENDKDIDILKDVYGDEYIGSLKTSNT